ncbi:hypothetical protein [Larkinella ripae]
METFQRFRVLPFSGHLNLNFKQKNKDEHDDRQNHGPVNAVPECYPFGRQFSGPISLAGHFSGFPFRTIHTSMGFFDPFSILQLFTGGILNRPALKQNRL